MAVGDIYFIRDVQELLGQECINTYWYEVVVEPSGSGAPDLLLEWQQEVQLLLLDCQTDELTHTGVECFLWSDPASDFAANATPVTGTEANNQPMPSSIAFSYRSPYGGPGTKYSWKRFAGITELYAGGNTISNDPKFLALETPLGMNLTGAAGGQYAPVQVAHSVAGVPVLPPLGTGNPVRNRFINGDWTFIPRISTQNTRKPS